MKVSRRPGGFGILEALMALLMVGVILGIVARGYQAMNRMNLATYQMSQRMELSAFLQRLSNEVMSALSVTVNSSGFSFTRINPTLNLTYFESTLRLPWEPINGIPPGVTTADLMNAAYQVTTTYRFDSPANQIERTAFGETSIEAVNVGEFSAATESGGRILAIMVRPKEMTAEVKARVLLPVVTP